MSLNNSINNTINNTSFVEFKNLLIGSNFDTNPWQRGTSFTSVATGTYSADRYKYLKSGSFVHSIAQSTNVPQASKVAFNVMSSLSLTTTTASSTVAAGDYSVITQYIEGDNYAPYGTLGMNLSFWVYASVAGNYSVFFANTGATHSYVAPYTITTANTWQFITIKMPAPTLGSWNFTNGIGIQVGWTLSSGTTYQTSSTNQWIAGQYFGSSGQANINASANNIFSITLAQFEVGSTYTGFESRPIGIELGLCQRYFQKTFPQGVTPVQNVGSYNGCYCIPSSTSGTSTGGSYSYLNTMRAAPVITIYNPMAANAQAYNPVQGASCTGTAVYTAGDCNAILQATSTAGGLGTTYGQIMAMHLTLNADY